MTAGWVMAAPAISIEAGKERTSKRVSRGHIDIAGPMPVVLAGEREYVYMYVVVDDYTRTV